MNEQGEMWFQTMHHSAMEQFIKEVSEQVEEICLSCDKKTVIIYDRYFPNQFKPINWTKLVDIHTFWENGEKVIPVILYGWDGRKRIYYVVDMNKKAVINTLNKKRLYGYNRERGEIYQIWPWDDSIEVFIDTLEFWNDWDRNAIWRIKIEPVNSKICYSGAQKWMKCNIVNEGDSEFFPCFGFPIEEIFE